MTDPNGYFTNASGGGSSSNSNVGPQDVVVVKIQILTTRPELNGRLGIAGGYQADRGRYLIRLVPNGTDAAVSTAASTSMLSLKPEHVVLANWRERMQAQYQLLRYDPQVHQEIRNLYQQCERRVAPLPLPAAAGMVALMWLASCYFIGFTNTIFWTSLVGLFAIYVAPFLIKHDRSIRFVFNNFPNLVQQQLERRVPVLRGRLDKTRTMGIMVAVVIMILLACGYVMRSSLRPKPTLPWDSTPTRRAATKTSTATTATSSTTKLLSVEEYYKLGFEDAKNGKSYGTSLPAESEKPRVLEPEDGMGLDDFPSSSSSSIPPPLHGGGAGGRSSSGSGSTSNFLSTLLSAFFVGRTVWDLGRDRTVPLQDSLPTWNWQRAQQMLTTLPTWQLGILVFSVYRLGSALMGMMSS
jgi:hypothetical protein